MTGEDWPGTDDLGDRLRETLKLRGLTFRAAGDVLQEAGVRGAHFTNLHAIAKGQTPSLSLIEGIARILQVNPSWLAFGIGEPDLLWTETHQRDYGVSDLHRDIQHMVVGLGTSVAVQIEERTLDDQFELQRLFARRIAAALRFLARSPLFVPLSDESDSILGAERIVEGLRFWIRKDKIDREAAEADPILSKMLELAPASQSEEAAAG